MRFAINSNLVPEKSMLIDRLITASFDVNNLEIYTSCESIGAQSEYIRDGFNYSVWRNNIVRLLKESNVKKIHMMMTINSLCLENITKFMDDMLELRKEFGKRAPTMTLNILRFPSFQSAAILPDSIKTKFKKEIEYWFNNKISIGSELSDLEKEHVKRLIDYLDVVKTPHRNTAEEFKLFNDFRSFFEQYDIRRGKNFRKVFPSFVEWYDSIPYNHESIIRSVVSTEDPATIDEFLNDDKKNVGGWNVNKDTLGG
jgi:hypothetical protein